MDHVPEGPVSIDVAANLRRAAAGARRRAVARLATSDQLPLRPNIEWYRKQAKRRLQTLRTSHPAVRLAEAQQAVARETGHKSWRHLVQAIDIRNAGAKEFKQAVESQNEVRIRALFAGDLGPLLDAGVELGIADLRWLRRLDAADRFLLLLHDVLVMYGGSRDLAERLEILFDARNDWEFAMVALRDRIEGAEADPTRAEEIEPLNNALGQLAWYDEPDFDYMPDGD